MNTAQIVLEVDDAGALTAFRAINAEGAKLAPGLAPAAPAMEKLTKSTKEGREAAALLSEEFGIKMPRALRGIAADAPVIGTALRAAFSGLAVAAFIEVVKSAVDNLTGFSEQLKVTAKQNEELMKSVETANKALIGPQNLRQVNEEFLKTQKSVERLNQELGLTGDALGDALKRGLTKYSYQQTVVLEELDKEKAKLNELADEQAKLTDEQRRTEPVEVLKLQNAARLEGLEGIKKINEQERGETAVVRAEIAARIVTYRVGMAQINDIHAKATAEREKTQRDANITGITALLQSEAAGAHGEEQIRKELAVKLYQLDEQERQSGVNVQYARLAAEKEADAKVVALRRAAAEETIKLEEEASVAILPPWKRSYAQIAIETQDKLRQIQQRLKDTTITSEEAAQQSAAVWQINFAKTRDQLAGDLQSLFDDITSGNIGKRFKKMFEDMVFQMVATWILGMGQMRGAASVAMGGGPGGILGALFGLGGGGFGGAASPGGTPPFLPAAGGILNLLGGGGGGGLGSLPIFSGQAEANGAFSLFGLGLSAGGGTTSPGMVLPSGAGPQAGGILGALGGGGLGGIFGLAALGGGALIGSKNTFVKSIGGLLLGGGIGAGISSAIAGTALGALLGPIGAFLGPIGALAGFLIPLIGGLFGEHKGDKARKEVMEPLMAQIKVIRDSYDVFQTDYNTGVGELETLRSQAIDSLRKIGGRQVRGNTVSTNRLVDDAEAYLKRTEGERQRRAQLTFGPAQFHSGGLVGPSIGGVPAGWGGVTMHSGGEVPAILQAGEFVVKKSTVRRVGVDGLNRMNAGGSTGDVHIHISAVDAPGFESWLTSTGGEALLKYLRRAGREGIA